MGRERVEWWGWIWARSWWWDWWLEQGGSLTFRDPRLCGFGLAFTAYHPTAHGCRWVDVRRTAHCRPRRENAFIVFFERVPDPNA